MTIQMTSNFQFHCIVQPVPTRPLSTLVGYDLLPMSAYVNPGMNAAIPTRGSSKWMMRTKTTASRRSMRTTFDLDFDLGSHK